MRNSRSLGGVCASARWGRAAPAATAQSSAMGNRTRGRLDRGAARTMKRSLPVTSFLQDECARASGTRMRGFESTMDPVARALRARRRVESILMFPLHKHDNDLTSMKKFCIAIEGALRFWGARA